MAPTRRLVVVCAFLAYQNAHCYTEKDLMALNEKTNFTTTREMIEELITPKTVDQVSPEAIQNILDNDPKNLLFTKYVLEAITPENLNRIRPIVIRHLTKKAESLTGRHIIHVLQKKPDILRTINPASISLFLMTASNGYAIQIAKLITPDLLSDIDPDIIMELMKYDDNAVAHHLIPLINRTNVHTIHPRIHKALGRFNSYQKRMDAINLELDILSKKDDEEHLQKELKKKRRNKSLLQS